MLLHIGQFKGKKDLGWLCDRFWSVGKFILQHSFQVEVGGERHDLSVHPSNRDYVHLLPVSTSLKMPGQRFFFPFLFLMQNSLPVVYEMMHFVFLLPLLPRKHLNPLMSQFRAHFVSSNAHSLPDVLGCRNPLKIARKDKLQPELIHHVKRHMYCNFCDHGFATRLIITSNEDGFHFCRYCTLWFISPASEEAEQKLR